MNWASQGMIEILQPGIGTTIQDRGRAGHRHEGIPLSGWLDAPLAEAANALVGNAGGEAVLELRGMGTELRITSGPVCVLTCTIALHSNFPVVPPKETELLNTAMASFV